MEFNKLGSLLAMEEVLLTLASLPPFLMEDDIGGTQKLLGEEPIICQLLLYPPNDPPVKEVQLTLSLVLALPFLGTLLCSLLLVSPSRRHSALEALV